MEKLVLNFVGIDSFSRPVYKDYNGQLFKDVNLGNGTPDLCTVYGGIEGEPDTPIIYKNKYQNVEIVLVGCENETTNNEKLNYQMLDRLRSECDYYLCYGERSNNCLYYKDEKLQIDNMKKLHNAFKDDKKPNWLTYEQILNYEKLMINTTNN